MGEAYDALRARLRHVATLRSVEAVLGWDQETNMPPAAAPLRAEQLTLMARLAHEAFTSSEIGDLIAASEGEPDVGGDAVELANLREIRRDWERARKLPNDLVAEISQTSSRAMEAWKQARGDSDFSTFRPWLEKQIELARTKAEAYGVPAGGETYDALVDDYEPEMRATELERLFAPLREATVEMLEAVRQRRHVGDAEMLDVEIPIPDQERFNAYVLKQIGFQMNAGRLDTSTHPFSTGIGPGDTRVTTRFQPDQFVDALGSTMHEAGHAMYEQGIPRERRFGQPLAESVSLGIHESQSRLWENHVGRSAAFWCWAGREARRFFSPVLDHIDADSLFPAVNTIKPHPIRVESDELTYNLHIMLRFDLERAMVRGDLAVRDLPAAWNDRMRSDLGLEIDRDDRGCLQDIHWSMGAIGYFPTYTLGNLYGAQFWQTLQREQTDVDEQMSLGRFEGVLDWLRERIHVHGRRFPAPELCRRVTGRDLDPKALIEHLGSKVDAVYPRVGAASS